MHIEKGVELTELSRNITAILKIVHLVFYESRNQMVITAAKWGRDNLRYAHEHGYAIDLAPPLNDRAAVLYRLKEALGINYCVLDMKTHFHVGFDPMADFLIGSHGNALVLAAGTPIVEVRDGQKA